LVAARSRNVTGAAFPSMSCFALEIRFLRLERCRERPSNTVRRGEILLESALLSWEMSMQEKGVGAPETVDQLP